MGAEGRIGVGRANCYLPLSVHEHDKSESRISASAGAVHVFLSPPSTPHTHQRRHRSHSRATTHKLQSTNRSGTSPWVCVRACVVFSIPA